MSKHDLKQNAPFKNYEEEVAFWETHDVLKLREPGTSPVVSKGGNKAQSEYKDGKKLEESLNIRFNDVDLKKIRTLAYKKGMGPTTLVRMWTKEKLQEETLHL